MNNKHSLPALTLAILVAAVLAACSGKDAASAGGAPGGGMPPPPAVGVVTVAPQSVALQTELPGRVEALRTAQVRARVNGVVLQRLFREGSEVRAGQPLFQIDPAPYQAALASANAQLARAQASLAQATATVERYKPAGRRRRPSASRTTSTRRLRRRAPRPTWPPAAPRCRRPASTWATRA